MADVRSSRQLLLITLYYHPEPGFITKDVATALARYGRVVVVTAQPNYPEGRYYPGAFSWLPRRFVEPSGVVVWRLPIITDRSNSKLRRLLSYLSFTAGAALLSPFVAPRPTTVWVYQTPFTAALAALWFRVVLRSRLVYTIVDLWPESLLAAGMLRPGRMARAVDAFSRSINRFAHVIACTTRGMLERFAADGMPRDRLRFVPVWIPTIPDRLPAVPPPPSRPRIVYVGNLGSLQGLSVVVRAAALLEREGVDVAFDLHGTGTEREMIAELVRELGVRSVTLHGRLPETEAMAVSAAGTAQLVCLRPTPHLERTIPSKLFFALATGAPILAGLRGEPAELAAATGGAIVFDSEDPASLADAVRRVIALDAAERARMSAALRTSYETEYSRSHLVREHVKLIYPDVDPCASS